MVRKKRFICPGYCYHVMLRGVGGRNIFDDDRDRAHFCLLLQYASETCNFSVHGFCFMSNHVHLLIQAHSNDLASGMHRLGFRYAQFYNKKVRRKGYLFQGRYRAILVQNGVYLRRLIRYIHCNPVRANLETDLSAYDWSSHKAYIGETEFTWLKTNLILPLFGSEPQTALELFKKYVCSDDEEAKIELEEIRKSSEVGAYGNDVFIDIYRQALESGISTSRASNTLEMHASSLEKQPKITLEMLVNALNDVIGTSLEELQSSNRKIQLVDARAAFVCLGLKFKLCSIRDLAKLLKRDPTSIPRLEERAQTSLTLRELIDEISSQLISKN